MTTETMKLMGERRSHLGTKYSRRLRQNGKIPAVVYGHGETPESIALDQHAVQIELAHHNRMLTVQLDDAEHQFLIKAVQYDHLDSTPIHLDLMRVDLNERVTVQVEVVLRGVPKGAHEGGMLLHPTTSVEIECLVTQMPEEFRISVVNLDVGESITAGDLKLPDGVTLITSADEVIAVCRPPTVPVLEEEEAVEPTSAEPEMIGRPQEDEEA